MARSKAIAWGSIVAGLVLAAGATTPHALAQPPVTPPPQARPSRAYAALNMGLECNRRGDYEQADVHLQQARAAFADLSPAEQKELTSALDRNGAALAARRAGAEQLRQAEQALAAGRTAEAGDLVRKALGNPHLSGTDRHKAQQLSDLGRVRPGVGSPTPPAGPQGSASAVARTKLQQARGMMAQQNWDAAELLARDADRLGVVYGPGEDTPLAVLEEISKVRSDPKQLLAGARAALQRGELDRAEQMATAAEKVDTSWHLWGDSAAAVKKDIATARARKAPVTPTPTPEADKGGVLGSVRGMFGTSKKTDPETPPQPAVKEMPKPAPEPAQRPTFNLAGFKDTPSVGGQPNPAIQQAVVPPEGDDPATKQARMLLQQARQALQAGDYPKAIQLAGQAKGMRPNLGWNDDTPDKVVADVQKAVMSKGPGGAPPVASKPTTNEDPKALLQRGRELLAAGNLDEAAQAGNRARAAQARGAKGGNWFGLFEDSPDKLLQDVDRARNVRNQQDSVQVLAEGRKKLAAGQLEEAAQCAYKAQNLHGPYSMLDLGDRPQKLLADIQSARDKQRETKLPPAPPAPGAKVAQGPKGLLPFGQKPTPEPTTAKAPTTPFAQGATPGAGDSTKQRAAAMLAQARQLQSKGQLIEARRVALDAQALRAAFNPGEDTPEQVLIQLSSDCYKRVETLKLKAAEEQALAGNDRNKLEKVVQSLMVARENAAAFGLDTQPIDSRLAELRTPGSPIDPPGAIRVAGGTQVDPPAPGAGNDPGLDMLAQARAELRNNQLGNARRLAEGAFRSGRPGSPLQQEAERMLRTIDAEEFSQRRTEAQRGFEAGCAAYRRREFSQAATIFRSLDKKLLDDTQRSRLAQITMTPEMQPQNLVTQVADVKPGVAGTQPTTPNHTGPSAPDFGRASVSDSDPQKDLLKQTQAMQDIKFQQLRTDGLNAQRDAADRFKSGDTDGALEALQSFLGKLDDVQLDNDRVALLRRPVDARLLQFKTLKAQRDFEKNTLDARNQAKNTQGQIALVQMNKEKKVKELMDQHRTFYKEGKYKEAEMYAAAAFDLDPDNAMAAAAVKMSRIQRNQTQYQKVKERGENMFVDALDQAQDVGEYVDTHKPVVLDAEHTRRIHRDRKQYGHPITIGTKGEKEREIESKLNTPVNLNFTDTPLSQALEDLRSWQSINIVIDVPALKNEGIDITTPVSMKLENVSLKSALNLLLHQVHLEYVIKDEVLNVTTKKQAAGRQETKTYQVADLVIPVENFALPNSANVMKILDSKLTRPNGVGTAATPYTGPLSLPGGSQASTPGTGVVGTNAGAGTNGGIPVADMTASNRRPGQTMEDLLIKLITNTIAPQSWSDMGGQGSIDYFPLGMALVINQTVDIQEQIAQLLDALRRLQELEVAVEVRFITLAENFYERIGLDFNINVKTDRETARFEPQLTQQAFKPLNFVNDFSPDHFITGLTPAGTFTSDLDIPIRTSSFGMGIPPFGGFPNIPGGNGGIELGLAFLSDIQVFLFMEAAQGDQRTNVMQAPKLTLFNGQTASILIQDQQFFVTDVVPAFAGGQLTFIPTNTPIPTGVALPIQAVVSADRRFVRLSMQQLTITNLASAVVPLFPLVFAVTPQFEGGFAGNPVLFTQFIQQPVINTIQVNTTVTVPDGGTVVLGGLKRLSEGRNEFGPPILSKIPYVNRLFKNVGFGREVTSLLIMVTPRIIINEEEEFRQTGVGIPPGGP